MKRSILIEGIDKELELEKFVVIHAEKQFINLDQLPNGKWRLVVTSKTIPDMTKVSGFKIKREE